MSALVFSQLYPINPIRITYGEEQSKAQYMRILCETESAVIHREYLESFKTDDSFIFSTSQRHLLLKRRDEYSAHRQENDNDHNIKVINVFTM